MEIPFIPAGYLPWVVGGALALVSLRMLSAILSPPKEDPKLYVLKRCACGWTGRVSKLSPVCRKCGVEIPLV